MNQPRHIDSPFIVAIDGPVGSGKSSVGRLVAKSLGFLYVDTGAIYRSVGYQVKTLGIDMQDEQRMIELCNNLNLRFGAFSEKTIVFLGDNEVTDLIRQPEISMMASQVSSLKWVRNSLVNIQRLAIKGHQGAVLDGRDIGTVIFPDAPVKVYLEASAEIRAKRRYDELIQKGQNILYDSVLADLQKRDFQDMNRETAPLKCAEDATVINSSHMTIQHVADEIVSLVIKKKNP